jgi:predicted enzyme related to lactoylglutathione lyase
VPTRLDEIVLDSSDPARTARWWARALGWTHEVTCVDEAVVAPPDGLPGVPIVVGGVPDAAAGGARCHLDLASASATDQHDTVQRLVAAGARPVDVGQGDVPWVVLADPDGMTFCVLEPREAYARAGALAAVVLDALDPVALGRFWASATGWGVASAGDGVVALRPPGTDAGPALELVATRERKPDGVKNRVHVDVAPLDGPAARDAEVERLLGLGARRVDLGQDADERTTWTVLTDPEGNEFCVLGGLPG